MPFTEVFAALGLRRPGTAAVDVTVVLDRLEEVTDAICGVLAALVTVIDPEVVVLGGDRGPPVVAAVNERFGRYPRPVAVRAARVTDEPALTGARSHALAELRQAVVDLRTP